MQTTDHRLITYYKKFQDIGRPDPPILLLYLYFRVNRILDTQMYETDNRYGDRYFVGFLQYLQNSLHQIKFGYGNYFWVNSSTRTKRLLSKFMNWSTFIIK